MEDFRKLPAPTATQLKRDRARILSEMAGTDGGIDPFPAAVRATRMPMVITDPNQSDNPIVFVNQSFCRLTGYSRDEIIGRNCRFLQGPETDAASVQKIKEAISAPRSVEVDIRNHRKDGTPFWNRLLLAPVHDAAGQLAYFFASQLDVSMERDRLAALEGENATLTAEREANQVRLEFSEQSLRLATEAAEVGTWDLDLFTDTLTWSDRTRAMFGISPGQPCSMADFYAGLHPDDLEATRAAFASAIDPMCRAVYDVEYRTIGKEDGRVRWVAAKGKGLFDRTARCVRALGTAIDITEKRNAEDRLRDSERRARENAERIQLALAAGAILGTWLWDPVTDCFKIDGRFASTFNLDPALGHDNISFADIMPAVHPDDRAGLTSAVNEACARGGSFVHQYRTCYANGQYNWLEANGRVDLAADGTVIRFPGVFIDIEERRAAETERARVTEELRGLNETLEQRVAERSAELMRTEDALRQSQKMEAVGQLTGGLAHDFNNLLAGISGSLELMHIRMQQGRFKDVERYMTAAQGAATRAAALTHRLLAFSRRQTLDPRPTNVNRLVLGMQEMVQRTVGPSIVIEVVGASSVWPALVDPSQLENALLNLCINARDAMPDGGVITIETANKWMNEEAAQQLDMQDGQYLSLCVTDTGVGMPPEVIAHVFEPFFTTKPIGGGTGLGLSMIYGFAQQSGGQVRIYSEVGQGTTVCIYLPRHYGAVVNEDAAEQPVSLPRAEQWETVLIVDDEPTVRMLIKDILDDLGYKAIEASDSAAGLKVLQSDVRIDLLVTDVGLPGGMNGRQMADAARNMRPDLKVLFITGYAENAILSSGKLKPGMAILTKPFAIESMAARIRSIMEAGKELARAP